QSKTRPREASASRTTARRTRVARSGVGGETCPRVVSLLLLGTSTSRGPRPRNAALRSSSAGLRSARLPRLGKGDPSPDPFPFDECLRLSSTSIHSTSVSTESREGQKPEPGWSPAVPGESGVSALHGGAKTRERLAVETLAGGVRLERRTIDR